MAGGGGTQKTKTDPWSGQQEYLRDIFGQAQELYRGGPQQYFPGQTVAGFAPQTETALGREMHQAFYGDPSQAALGQYLTGAMRQPYGVDPLAIYGRGAEAARGIPLATGYLEAAGQPLTYGQAAGMAGVDPRGTMRPQQAVSFFGDPAAGTMPATQQFVETALGGITPDFMRTAADIQAGGFTGVDPTTREQLAATAGGAYMPGANPYLDALYQTGAERIGETFREQTMPELAGMFGTAGRTGSGAQALMAGRAAGDVAGELAGLYGDIYAPAYEAERGRQLEAAGMLGEMAQRGGIAGLGTAADVYGRELGQQLGAAQLGGDLYSRLNAAEMARRGAAADLYGTMSQQDIARRSLAGDIYGAGMGRTADVGARLGTLGLGGLESMRGLYGDVGTQAYRGAALAPTLQQMQYADIDRMLRGGAQREEQAQRLIDAARARWEFEQMAPYQALGRYADIVQGMPSGYGTTTERGGGGSPMARAMGGAMAGGAIGGPWGAAAGGLGGLLM